MRNSTIEDKKCGRRLRGLSSNEHRVTVWLIRTTFGKHFSHFRHFLSGLKPPVSCGKSQSTILVEFSPTISVGDSRRAPPSTTRRQCACNRPLHHPRQDLVKENNLERFIACTRGVSSLPLYLRSLWHAHWCWAR